MRKLFLILILTAFIIPPIYALDTEEAFACSCIMTRSPEVELGESYAVFSGTVVDKNPAENLMQRYTIDVDRVWKGNVSKKAYVFSGSDSAMCGYGFQTGEKYLIYTYKDTETSNMNTTICSGTKPLANAQADLAAIGEGSSVTTGPEIPDAVNSKPSVATSIALIIVLITVLIVLKLFTRKSS